MFTGRDGGLGSAFLVSPDKANNTKQGRLSRSRVQQRLSEGGAIWQQNQMRIPICSG
jgi:hypothetical protein